MSNTNMSRGSLILSLILIPLLSLSVLTACGTSEEETSSTSTEQSSVDKLPVEEPATPEKTWPKFLRIGGAPSGSGGFMQAAAYAKALEDNLGIKVTGVPGAAVQNVKSVHAGEIEMAYTMSDVLLQAFKGESAFTEAIPELRWLFFNFASIEVFHVRADSDIYTIEDLRDKKIALGDRGMGADILGRAMLKQYGITEETIKKTGGVILNVPHSQAGKMLLDKTLDCHALTANIYGVNPALSQVEETVGLRLVPVSEEAIAKAIEEFPLMSKGVIPSGIYRLQKEPYPSISTNCVYFTKADIPDDLVYELIKTVYLPTTRESILDIGKIFNSTRLENALVGANIPVHPGAMKYYEDNGVKRIESEILLDSK